jgi:hypothetical protein
MEQNNFVYEKIIDSIIIIKQAMKCPKPIGENKSFGQDPCASKDGFLSTIHGP